MTLEHTSVPHWAATPPAVPATARQVTVLGIGSAAGPVVRGWEFACRELGLRPAVLLAGSAEEAMPRLAVQLQGASVGWRLLVAGPEADVLRARSRALEAGAVPAEVLTFVTGVPVRRVHCAHCRTETETGAAVGGTCPCAGCGRTLHVYHHVSRRLGAYLGYMIDAEDAAPAHVSGGPA
ncbi:dimethylamine monooxygenase subunit DmmA family protein [Modestobacter excelsi]|uniref:dimethylamine monooxygenase subunit DmmA family protein n=1 Tax=Modestobacter excelsi TaxID=2213161 RepID=UPI00110CB0B3|nr:dimethylamine monooxygenase subunit DmmA family protein [Modestobacter excelsi]